MRKADTSMELSLADYRRFALMSLWTGMIVTVGVGFALIPNIELITISAFLGGVALGPKRGFLVAALGEAIFSALNPIGSGLGFPVLFAFQIVSVGVSGLLGGLLRGTLERVSHGLSTALILGFIGFILTLLYDSLTALSFPISAGLTEGTLGAILATGLVFFIMHLVSNTLLFGMFGPSLVSLVRRQLDMHGMDLK